MSFRSGRDRRVLRPLPEYVPVSSLQLRIARTIFELASWDLYEVMRVYGVKSSQATLWRASQDSSRRHELQAEMRRVYESLGLIFYEHEGVGFHAENAPSQAEIDRINLPRGVVEVFKRLRAEVGEPTVETRFVKRLDGKPTGPPGRPRANRGQKVEQSEKSSEKAEE